MHAGLPQHDYHNVMFNSCTKIVHRQLWDRVAGGPNRGDVQHASTGRTFLERLPKLLGGTVEGQGGLASHPCSASTFVTLRYSSYNNYVIVLFENIWQVLLWLRWNLLVEKFTSLHRQLASSCKWGTVNMGMFICMFKINVTTLGCWNNWHENFGAIQGLSLYNSVTIDICCTMIMVDPFSLTTLFISITTETTLAPQLFF